MSCKGLHCPGCGNSGGGAAGAVVALLVIIALALRKSWPAIVSAVEIAAWTVAGVTGAAIVITAGVLTVRAVRRRRARRAPACRPVHPYAVVVDATQRMFTEPFPPASGEIEPPRWPLTGWQSRRELYPRIGGDGDEHRGPR